MLSQPIVNPLLARLELRENKLQWLSTRRASLNGSHALQMITSSMK